MKKINKYNIKSIMRLKEGIINPYNTYAMDIIGYKYVYYAILSNDNSGKIVKLKEEKIWKIF